MDCTGSTKEVRSQKIFGSSLVIGFLNYKNIGLNTQMQTNFDPGLNVDQFNWKMTFWPIVTFVPIHLIDFRCLVNPH